MLLRPIARDPVDVAEHLLAVQAQDLRGAQLAVRARSTGLSVADINRALTEDRSLLITWLNRGTLHLVRSEDYWWLQELTAPQLFTGNARRLGQEGVSPAQAERGVELIVRAIERDGPQTRIHIRERLVAAKIPVAGQGLVHILMLASLRGHIVRGPMVGRHHAFVLVRDWLGAPPPSVDRDSALAWLAHRYLMGHGPASDRDLARWAGIPLGEARAGLKAIGATLVETADGLVDLARPGVKVNGLPAPRLLGPWDPALVGWSSREWLLGAEEKRIVVGGLFRSFALIRGRPVATWNLKGPEPKIEPFGPLGTKDGQALQREADAVVEFLRENREARRVR
jgi:hypothetical protein